MKKNIQCHKQHTLLHKRHALLCEIWKAIFWNANNGCLFIFFKNMSQFPQRPVFSALALFLESCVCLPALPFMVWEQRRSVLTANAHTACPAWIIKSLPPTRESCIFCQHLWNSACLTQWLAKRETPLALRGSLQLRWSQRLAFRIETLLHRFHPLWTHCSSQLPPVLSITSSWEMLVISWVLTLDSGLRISLWAQGALISGRAGTPAPETTSLVHHRAFVFYFILIFNFYRSIVYLQGFRYIAQWLSCIYIPF